VTISSVHKFCQDIDFHCSKKHLWNLQQNFFKSCMSWTISRKKISLNGLT
jgi:hypothetical protein